MSCEYEKIVPVTFHVNIFDLDPEKEYRLDMFYDEENHKHTPHVHIVRKGQKLLSILISEDPKIMVLSDDLKKSDVPKEIKKRALSVVRQFSAELKKLYEERMQGDLKNRFEKYKNTVKKTV